jgi:hypothetical protein
MYFIYYAVHALHSNDQRMKQQESFLLALLTCIENSRDCYRMHRRLQNLIQRIYAYSRASMARIENAQGLCVRTAVL